MVKLSGNNAKNYLKRRMGMFENAGRKIKGFAKFLFVINLLGGFAGGIYYAIDAKMTHDVIYAMVAFLIVFFVSIILALFVSYLLSGFGELICQITAIAEKRDRFFKPSRNRRKG